MKQLKNFKKTKKSIQHIVCTNDEGLLRMNLKGVITSPRVRPGFEVNTYRTCESGKYFVPFMGKDLTSETQSMWIFQFLLIDKDTDRTGEKAFTSVKNSRRLQAL